MTTYNINYEKKRLLEGKGSKSVNKNYAISKTMATYNIHYEKPRLADGKNAKLYIRITQRREMA